MSRTCLGIVAILCICLTGTVVADDYNVTVDGSVILSQPWASRYVSAHCFDGSSAYCIVRGKIRDLEKPFYSEWGSEIVRIDDIDTNPVATVLVSNAQWKSFLGLNENGTDCDKELYYWGAILAGNRVAVVGDYFQYMDNGRTGYAPGATQPDCETDDFSLDAVYRVHKDTGELSVFVSKQAFKDFLGLTEDEGQPPNNPQFNGGAIAFSVDNDMLVYEDKTDHLIQIDAAGNLRILISKSEFVSVYGYSPVSMLNAMDFDSQGRLYWGLKGGGGGAGGCIFRRNCDGTIVRMVSQQDIKAASGSTADSNFFDLYVGPDERLYVYDGSGTAYGILSFDVNDPNLPHTGGGALPEGVITYYLTAAQLTAGAAQSKYVSSFDSRGSDLTWVNGLSLSADDIYSKPLVGPRYEGPICECPWLPLADFNGDRKIDGLDIPIFVACATGPEVPYDPANLPSGCTVAPDCDGFIPADADADGDVDQVDFASFQRALTIEPP